MKKSKNLSLFRPAIFFLTYCLFPNPYLLIFTLLFLLLVDYKECLIFITLVVISYLLNKYNFDFIPIGYIDKVNSKYIIVNKYLYKTKIYLDTYNLSIGNLIKTNSKSLINNDITSIKNDIRYISYDEIKIIKSNTLFNKNYLKLLKYDSDISSLLTKVIFNEYIDNIIEIFTGYGLSSYLFLKFIYSKNKNLSLIITIVLSINYGFEIKYILIFIDYIISYLKLNKKDKFSFKIIFILMLNKYYFINYSFLITVLFSFFSILDVDFKIYVSIIQSLLFGEINILFSMFYKFYMAIQIALYILCLLILNIPLVSLFIFNLISFFSILLNKLSLTIRGKLNLILIVLIILLERKLPYKRIIHLIILFLLISPINNPLKHVSFIDVGQGDSILIRGELNKYNVLIDTGSKYNYQKLKTFLFKEGIYNIDYLIITHNDSDHNGNLDNLKRDFEISKIITEGEDISINDLYLKYLRTDKFDNDNENSLVYYTNINDLSYIFTGDITKNVERLLVNEYDLKDIDVLKVSHHGSDTGTSSYFVSKILPKFAIISTNGNYGHPKQEVINTLDSYLVKTYITKNDGNIRFYFTSFINVIKTDILHFDIIGS